MDEWKPPPLSIRVPWDAEQQRRMAERLFESPSGENDTRGRLGDGATWLSSRTAMSALGVLMIAGAVVVGWSWLSPTAPPPAVPGRSIAGTSSRSPEAGREIWFRDGSLALLQRPESELRVDVADVHSISATLIAGQASFDVVPRPERLFRVEAGAVVIEVLGTAFSVERRGVFSLVTVTRGRVRVSWPGGTRELPAGSEGLFPPPGLPLSGASPGGGTVAGPPTEGRPSEPPSQRAAAERPSAVTLAERPSRASAGSSEEAPPADPAGRMAAPGPSSPVDRTARPRSQPMVPLSPAQVPVPRPVNPSTPRINSSDLLLGQADLARIAGRPREAVELLQRLLRQYVDDGRAPLAAFTLGRILLDELHAPHEAAQAFAQARELAPTGPLVEDTYLREVEACVEAGQVARATERAEEYFGRFSGSPRAPLMRHLVAPR